MFIVAGVALGFGPFASWFELSRLFGQVRDSVQSNDKFTAGALTIAIGAEVLLLVWNVVGAVLFFRRSRAARPVLIGFFGIRFLLNVAGSVLSPAIATAPSQD